MLLSESLTKLKNLKSKAARVDKYITDSVVYYEDETPEYKYTDELQNRSDLENEIMQLKTKIQLTNSSTQTTFNGNNLSLTALVLLNARLRTELAFWNKLLNTTQETGLSLYRERTKDHVKKVYAEGYDKLVIRKTIDNLETSKEQVESLIASVNQSTNLVEPVLPVKEVVSTEVES